MQMPNLHLGALLSGSLNSTASHPVTLPKVIIKYEQKDITSDIQPYLLSVSYTDYLEGQSDEVQVELEDVDGRWRQKWYPEQGDKISLEIGDQINGMLKLPQNRRRWFCSEWCATALELPAGWRWSPNDLAAIVPTLYKKEV